jgi:hypothetical protein
LGIPFPEAIVAEGRVKAYFKWRRSRTQISELLENPYKSRTKTWVTQTSSYLKTYVRVTELELERGILDLKEAEGLAKRAAKFVTDGILASEAKQEYSGSMKQYRDNGFELTRLYIRQATWTPGLSMGVSWLIRFRTNSTWTRSRLWGYLQRDKGDDFLSNFPKSESYLCVACKRNIKGVDERWHVLIDCTKYNTCRDQFLGPYMNTSRQAAEVLKETGKPCFAQVVETMGILFLGGYAGETDMQFVKAYGHNPEVVLECRLHTYGFVPVALFLAKIMSDHVDRIFKSYDLSKMNNRRDGGYITDSQSDF